MILQYKVHFIIVSVIGWCAVQRDLTLAKR